jgi:hypothetical protein
MDIMMGLSAIKQTLDITKDLREIDGKINVADLKLRLSDMVERLLEAREALYDAKERERELLEKIAQLEAVLNKKPRLQDERGLLFEVDEDGARVGEPYCNHCYVKEERLFRLVSDNFAGGFGYQCHNCKQVFFVTRNRGNLRTLHDLGEDLA